MTRWDDHYSQLYDTTVGQGVAASLTANGASDAVPVTVVDKRKGVEVEVRDGTFSTMTPAADIRMSELTENSIGTDDLRGGRLTLAGSTYKITSWQHVPGPQGHGGEVRLVLQGKVV